MMRGALGLLACLSLHAAAAELGFDDLAAGTAVGEQYRPSGIVFGGGGGIVQEGLSQGDAGRWMLEGTAGPAFLGFNGFDGGGTGQTLFFDDPVYQFAMDVARGFGSTRESGLDFQAHLQGEEVASWHVAFGEVNDWTQVSADRVFDQLEWNVTGEGFQPYGVDNLAFSPVPEPGTLLWLAGAGALTAIRRRRAAAGK